MKRRSFLGALGLIPALPTVKAAPPAIDIFGPPEVIAEFKVAYDAYYKTSGTLTRANLDVLTPTQIRNLFRPSPKDGDERALQTLDEVQTFRRSRPL